MTQELRQTPLLRPARGGLYCKVGGFYIDPEEPVDTAVITHAHSDHARPGHLIYYATRESLPLLERRVWTAEQAASPDEPRPHIQPVEYGESFVLGEAKVSLHPAGHLLGSAQVRVEHERDGTSEVWVVSGDYKRGEDPTCRPFEPVECDVFITEATFALPIYRWRSTREVVSDIYDWWEENRREGRTSVLFAYSLGKAQRVLAELTRFTDRRVLLHGALVDFVDLYRDAGVEMPPTKYVTEMDTSTDFSGELVMAPPSAFASSWMKRFGDYRTAFASGWMRVRGIKRRRGYDTGFVLSDHVDWPELLQSIEDVGARRVLATHGKTEALVRYLREERGLDAWGLESAYVDGGPYA
ncbi:ligase-associated DNA damage response exonuclease [Persicimonas caeni]|uniref:Ligase-associated DNA damage response exonuclease n=1 Tax=Persicimonas caeni TaxID=2292766 RepID=A0A4Y6PNC9_PERCE|nr:ligase-associated DNA damage response exonuclease [Persicimonas caeni]QDG49527.1 ligase-associated DNA damage response exonuclease [Persicimonas caeni]QED30748.1 ligase-associated DNA damage response exonuclease [Persicimonas caeni]